MITNQNDIDKYIQTNKIYIPQNYNNSYYSYRFNSDNYIYIITNQNCYTQYNTTYCDCYNYNYKENVVSQAFTCNTNSNNGYIIPYESITSNINYNDRIVERFIQDKGIIIGMFIIGIIIAILLTKESRY